MRLGPVLRGWVKHEEKSLRGLGKEMGLDQATLWRFMALETEWNATSGILWRERTRAKAAALRAKP